MSVAFISHSSKNKSIVEEIYKRLGPNNCIVDQFTFEAGAKTMTQIFESLKKTDLFVLIISGAALDSEWVKTEINMMKERLDFNQIKRFLPINIDQNVTHLDERIPLWIRQNYNLKHIHNPNIIAHKIKRHLLEITIESNPKIAERLQNFVGRNGLIEEFEEQFINIENIKPGVILISGVEGAGRRSFLKKALEKNKIFSNTYDPPLITLESTDGIDDLILKLDEGHYSYKKDFVAELRRKEEPDKIDSLKEMILEYLDNHEFIFFIDNGCLVLSTGDFNEWFISLVNNPEFYNRVSFCVISRYRPSKFEYLKIRQKHIAQHVPPLSDADKEKLFVRVMNNRDIKFDKAKLETVLSFLNGFPDQIFYTADLIQKEGINNVLKMRDYITDFYDHKLIHQFTNIIHNPKTRDIVVVLAHFGTISYDYMVDIFYENADLDEVLEQLYTSGAYELVGLSKEFLKVNYALSDYIKRNAFQMSAGIQSRLKHKITTIIKEHSDIPTYSDTLNTLKHGLINGQSIPDRLLLPSLVLKSISALYDRKEYKQVINIGNRILENATNIEKQVKREIHYFLCLAYARLKDERFEYEVKNVDDKEREFLYGLYHRLRNNYKKAKDHLKLAVKAMPLKIQARSELVLTLLALEQYDEAESLALENFNKYKNNPFYIQSYYKCLVHKNPINSHDQELLEDLIKRMSYSPHPKAPDMKLVMEAQYEYYIKGDFDSAERKLKYSINNSDNKRNAINVLNKIYQNEKNPQGINYLNTNFTSDAHQEEED